MADREAKEGLLAAAVSDDGKTGALVEMNCETDFVAKNDSFKSFVSELAVRGLDHADGELAAAAEEDRQAKIHELGENMVVGGNTRYVVDGDGRVATYIHPPGKIGVMVEFKGTPGDSFDEVAKGVCMHIAANSPRFLTPDDVDEETVNAEKEIYAKQMEGKPADLIEKILGGKLKKFFSEIGRPGLRHGHRQESRRDRQDRRRCRNRPFPALADREVIDTKPLARDLPHHDERPPIGGRFSFRSAWDRPQSPGRMANDFGLTAETRGMTRNFCTARRTAAKIRDSAVKFPDETRRRFSFRSARRPHKPIIMKAIAYRTAGPIDREDALQDITLDKPQPQGRDVLVKVNAVSVNPVDVKLRNGKPPEGEWGVLGFDASGVVEAVGSEVQFLQPGDAVYYAGDLTRPGTNSELHLVDERIVGNKPASLSDAEAAALPLTAITAWEMLFDRLKVNEPTAQGGDLLLLIGGAGGVGSITIQLLRALTDITIIASASRPETQDWVRECGAHHVVNHREDLPAQIEALGLGAPGFVFSTTHTGDHLAAINELIAPQGRFGLIDDPEVLDVMPFKLKAVSTHWELMFTRSLFGTPDMGEQRSLLNKVAALVDAGSVRSTLTEVAGKIDAATLRAVHATIESNRARGKIVLEGF